MNFKHGFYSVDCNLNPDCLMIKNAEVKQQLRDFAPDIKDFLNGEKLEPDRSMLVKYLICCCLPHNDEFLPKGFEEKAREWWNSSEGLFTQKFLSDVN